MDMEEVSKNVIMRSFERERRRWQAGLQGHQVHAIWQRSEHQRMQQISELAMSLYFMISTMDQRSLTLLYYHYPIIHGSQLSQPTGR